MAVAQAGCCGCLCLLVNNKHLHTHAHARTHARTCSCICMRSDCVVKLFQYITPGPQSPWHHHSQANNNQSNNNNNSSHWGPALRSRLVFCCLGILARSGLVFAVAAVFRQNELENKCMRLLRRLAPPANRLQMEQSRCCICHRPHPPWPAKKPKWLLLPQTLQNCVPVAYGRQHS